jgi:hypothetical protein
MVLLLRDEPWQDIGFRRRPKYGALIQRLRPAWRVSLEKSITKEMLILFTAAHIAAGVVGRDQVEGLVRIYVGGPDGTSDLWTSLGYASRGEAEAHLRESVSCYLDAGIQEWLHLLPSRLQTLAIPDRALAGKLTVGAIKFAQTVQTMVLDLQAGR